LRQAFIVGKWPIHHLREEGSDGKSPGGLGFEAAVLAVELFAVGFELFVEEGVSDHLVFAFGLGIADQQPIIVEEVDGAVFDLQHYPLAHDRVGQKVAVGLVGDLTVLVDLSEHLQRGIILCRWKCSQLRLPLLPAFDDRLSVGAVDAPVGRCIEALVQISVGFFDRVKGISAPEALSDVVRGTFHLTLYLGPIGRAGFGRKAVIVREVQ
jgi:hypothetical protein